MKQLKRIFFVVAALATLVALIYAIENWRGTRDYQSVMDRLRTEGEVLEFSQLIPVRVPEKENFGSSRFLQELKQEGAPGSSQALVKGIYDSFRDVEEAETPEEFLSIAQRLANEKGIKAAPLEFLVTTLEPWQPIRQELAGRLSLPYSQWNRTFESGQQADGYSVFNLGVFFLMKLTAIQSHVHLLEGNHAGALEDILIGLRLGEMYQQEPGWIFHVIFLADLALMGDPIENGLRSQVWDQGQLDQLDQNLRKIDFANILQTAMRGERAFMLSFKDAATRSLGLGPEMGDDQPLWRHLAPRGWALRGFGTLSETYQQCIVDLETGNKAFGHQIDTWNRLWSGLEDAPATAWTAADHSIKLSGIGRADLDTARKLAVHRAVIQLAKFQLEQGNYPASLEELPTRPLDPLDSQLLVYERVGDGFRVEAPDPYDAYRFELAK